MRVVFLGTGDIGLPTLQHLLDAPEHTVAAVVTQPDKPVGRHQTLQAPPVKTLAFARGVPVLQPPKLRDPDAVEALRAFAPEVLVVMAYGQILPRAVLNLPPVACLNLHASLLPRHRGASPIQAAIEAGERESGITVMHMAEGLDTGDILLTHALPIRRRETGGTLHDRLALLAPAALAEALALLAAGRAPRAPQDPALATYAPKLSRDDGLLRWTEPAAALDRRIRAMNPWPGAFTFLPTPEGPRKLKVWTAIRHRRSHGPPGTVLRADRYGLLVAAGEGAVLLREVQLEGKRRMPAADLLRGHPVAPGAQLV